MKAFDLTGMALQSLRVHMLRAILTALGVIFGVASVVAMVSIAEGGKREALAQIQALGIRSILIESRETEERDEKIEEQKRERIKRYGLTDKDVGRLSRMLENLESITPIKRFRRNVYAQGMRLDVALLGVEPEFVDVANLKMVEGRNLHPLDGQRDQPVCILGAEAGKKIFRQRSVMGNVVWVGGYGHKVVGIFDNPSGAKVFGDLDPELTILIPRKTGVTQWGNQHLYDNSGRWSPERVEVSYLVVKVRDREALINTSNRVRRYLELAHPKEDYSIKVPLELLRQREATHKTFTIVMSTIAAISLLIGGIGIMNIMLANVYERRKEIGIHRALGSTRTDVLRLFLLETTFISVMGGLIGIPVSFAITYTVSSAVGWAVQTPSWVVVLAIGISAGVGILFGTYPAWQAASISPIEALRNE